PVYGPNHRVVPLLAYWDDIRPSAIRVRQPPAGGGGVLVLPASPQAERLSLLDPHELVPTGLRAPAGWGLAQRDRSWLVYENGPCTRRRNRFSSVPASR